MSLILTNEHRQEPIGLLTRNKTIALILKFIQTSLLMLSQKVYFVRAELPVYYEEKYLLWLLNKQVLKKFVIRLQTDDVRYDNH